MDSVFAGSVRLGRIFSGVDNNEYRENQIVVDISHQKTKTLPEMTACFRTWPKKVPMNQIAGLDFNLTVMPIDFFLCAITYSANDPEQYNDLFSERSFKWVTNKDKWRTPDESICGRWCPKHLNDKSSLYRNTVNFFVAKHLLWHVAKAMEAMQNEHQKFIDDRFFPHYNELAQDDKEKIIEMARTVQYGYPYHEEGTPLGEIFTDLDIFSKRTLLKSVRELGTHSQVKPNASSVEFLLQIARNLNNWAEFLSDINPDPCHLWDGDPSSAKSKQFLEHRQSPLLNWDSPFTLSNHTAVTSVDSLPFAQYHYDDLCEGGDFYDFDVRTCEDCGLAIMRIPELMKFYMEIVKPVEEFVTFPIKSFSERMNFDEMFPAACRQAETIFPQFFGRKILETEDQMRVWRNVMKERYEDLTVSYEAYFELETVHKLSKNATASHATRRGSIHDTKYPFPMTYCYTTKFPDSVIEAKDFPVVLKLHLTDGALKADLLTVKMNGVDVFSGFHGTTSYNVYLRSMHVISKCSKGTLLEQKKASFFCKAKWMQMNYGCCACGYGLECEKNLSCCPYFWHKTGQINESAITLEASTKCEAVIDRGSLCHQIEHTVLPGSVQGRNYLQFVFSPDYMRLRERYQYSFGDYLAKVGGILGLLVGGSLLSFIHTAYFLLMVWCQYIHAKERSNEQSNHFCLN